VQPRTCTVRFLASGTPLRRPAVVQKDQAGLYGRRAQGPSGVVLVKRAAHCAKQNSQTGPRHSPHLTGALGRPQGARQREVLGVCGKARGAHTAAFAAGGRLETDTTIFKKVQQRSHGWRKSRVAGRQGGHWQGSGAFAPPAPGQMYGFRFPPRLRSAAARKGRAGDTQVSCSWVTTAPALSSVRRLGSAYAARPSSTHQQRAGRACQRDVCVMYA
jgi:hypothetical protein